MGHDSNAAHAGDLTVDVIMTFLLASTVFFFCKAFFSSECNCVQQFAWKINRIGLKISIAV